MIGLICSLNIEFQKFEYPNVPQLVGSFRNYRTWLIETLSNIDNFGNSEEFWSSDIAHGSAIHEGIHELGLESRCWKHIISPPLSCFCAEVCPSKLRRQRAFTHKFPLILSLKKLVIC
jgi:hypothetical protein